MIGQILIYILFIVAFGSSLAYFFATRDNNVKVISIARILYFILTGGIVAASIFLFYNIVTHNFQYTYIWSYSSKNLPFYLLISSFYAGQEGSFLLWTLMLSVLGVFVLPYAKKYGYETWVMAIYSLIILFLLLILIAKSPFTMIWETFKDENLAVGFMPSEGRGMNPILQNYWIAIHPPILFLGYAAMTVPFIFAITGLIKKEYNRWINIAMPWTLFAAGILGLGIMLGAFWSYETLGWGGFWGWDPVENASLHPWLIATALIHTMLVQNKTGGLVKTNFALAILGFVLVLFATYLTRSGVLGEASVHSFVDPGQIVNLLLYILLLLFTLGGFLILIIRIKDMPKVKANFKFSSREMWLALSSILLIGFTILVIYGTTRPILPKFLVNTKAALAPAQFDNFSIPFVILILCLNAIAIYLNWGQTNWMSVFKNIFLALVLSIITIIISYFLGMKGAIYLILAWTAWFSLFINLELLIKNIRKIKYTGAFIAHLGVSFLILGTIASGTYSVTSPLALQLDKSVSALGYNFSLVKKERIERNYTDREKYQYVIKINKGNNSAAFVAPVVYWSNFNNYESPYFEPGIKRYFYDDLYISPKTWDYQTMEPAPKLKQGQTTLLTFDNNVFVKFIALDLSKSHTPQSNGTFEFGVIVQYDVYGKKSLDTLIVQMDMKNNKMNPIPKQIPGTDMQIMVNGFTPQDDMSKSEIELIIAKEIFYVDATVKPFINFVWLGVLFIVLGFFIPIAKNSKKSNSRNEAIDIIEEKNQTIKEKSNDPES